MPPASHGNLYQQVAHDIADSVHKGAYLPGDKMPSLRQLSGRLGVSISTVTQAYRLLESQGVVEVRPQSGYYVSARSRPPEPAISRPRPRPTPVSTGDLIASMLQLPSSPDHIQLAVATPPPDLLPTRKINRLLGLIGREQPQLGANYDLPPGRLELRAQIARLSTAGGCHPQVDDIVITSGCQEALTLCLRAVARAGDTIAVESPTYYGLLQAIEALGMHALEIPTHPRDGVCLEELEQAIGRWPIKACLFIPNHGNPLGSRMPDENKRRLVALLARHGIPLIEDDAYGDLHFHGIRPRTCKSYDEEGLVLLCSSFSKTLGPGYRVGWTMPGRHLRQVSHLQGLTHTTASPLQQLAIARFLAKENYQAHVQRLRVAYARQVEMVTRAVGQHFPPSTRVTQPAGGSVLWLELPPAVDTVKLYHRAREHGISFAPGVVFTAQRRYRNCLRLNCAHPWNERLAWAIATLGRLAREML
ncbi:MAG TPA: PLP-dependent aminotransferase family protein [Candidatus Competibacteraceae bacterium]|nr:PLP-dependent aminotransferase family protein [Candidatus Competibacteraceae bacterium]